LTPAGDLMENIPFTASNIRIRKSFAKNKQVIEIPNLIELAKKFL
jgi:DNA-directed RNA polymerase subunit beta